MNSPESPLISSIVTVYNAEQHLRKCLNQTCLNQEIICVNDDDTAGPTTIGPL